MGIVIESSEIEMQGKPLRDKSDDEAAKDDKDTEGGKDSSGKFDADLFSKVKTFAQGTRDVAILAANVSQLKFVIDVGEKHAFHYIMITLISISIILLVINLVLMTISSTMFNINKKQHQKISEIFNYTSTAFTCITVVLNIVINIFGAQFYGDEFPQSRECCDCPNSTSVTDDVIVNAYTKGMATF